MSSFADVLDEIAAFCRTTLDLDAPAAGAFNLLTSIQASEKSFVEDVKQGTIELDCLVIQIGDDEPDTEFGVANDLRRYPISFHLLKARGPGGTQRTIHADLKTLRQALEATTFTHFCVIERGMVRTGTENPIATELFVNADAQILGGTLSYYPGFQVDDA